MTARNAFERAGGGGSAAFAGCKLVANSQAATFGTVTLITWNTEEIDVGGYADLGASNNRITIPVGADGYYLVSALVATGVGSGDGLRFCQIRKNSNNDVTLATGTYIASHEMRGAPSPYGSCIHASAIVYLAAGDYIQLFQLQSSSAGVNATARMSVAFLGAAA